MSDAFFFNEYKTIVIKKQSSTLLHYFTVIDPEKYIQKYAIHFTITGLEGFHSHIFAATCWHKSYTIVNKKKVKKKKKKVESGSYYYYYLIFDHH